MNIFQQALTNAKPALEVKSRRVGGATYQVPVSCGQSGALAGNRWLIGSCTGPGE